MPSITTRPYPRLVARVKAAVLAMVVAAAALAADEEEATIRCTQAAREGLEAGVAVPIEATTRAGPIEAFILAVRFPARDLEAVSLTPAGRWLEERPSTLLETARAEEGDDGVILLAVLPAPGRASLPLVPRASEGAAQLIAELVLKLRAGAAPRPVFELGLAEQAISIGSGPPFISSLVINGQDYVPAGGDRKLKLNSGAIQLEDVPEHFRRGDATSDARVDISDSVFTLNWLFLGGAGPSCLDAADADDSGKVNITDPILVLNYLFLGGKSPAPPGNSDCGEDPTPDSLPLCCDDACR